MGNQQENISLAELGYLAGIIDGEGCIAMNVRKKSWNGWNGIGVDLKLLVTNTDGAILRKVAELFRKLGIEPYINDGGSKEWIDPEGNAKLGKNVIHVVVNRMADILHVLTHVSPFLIGEKHHRAEMMMEFIVRRVTRKGDRTKGGASWYNDADWSLVERFYVSMGKVMAPEIKVLLNDYTRAASASA